MAVNKHKATTGLGMPFFSATEFMRTIYKSAGGLQTLRLPKMLNEICLKTCCGGLWGVSLKNQSAYQVTLAG